MFYYFFIYNDRFFFLITRLHIFLSKTSATNELYLFCKILFRHVDLGRNLSKYPAAVDDLNEFLSPFSCEREFAILVDDTMERSPEGRFNFAKLAGSRVRFASQLSGLPASLSEPVLILECYLDIRFLIPNVLMQKHIRAI